MAEQEVIAIFRRIELLKNAECGAGDSDQDNQSEVFRLFGMIDWIHKLEGNRILEAMEDDALAARIQDGLEDARESLKRMPIGQTVNAVNLINAEGEDMLSSFPKYFDLPGLLVREKILSFLSPDDLFNVALVKPTEAKFFPQPLIYLKLRTIFPILMEKFLLEPTDVMNLSGVDPYVRSFILKHYEDVIWKDGNRLFNFLHDRERSITLQSLINDETAYPVVSHVRFELHRLAANDSTNLDQLRICGKRILHCAIKLNGREQIMQRIASYLALMPNLKTLSIEDPECVTQDDQGLLLPELPFLRNLVIYEHYGGSALQRMLLRKYGEKLELVWLHTAGEPNIRFQVPGTSQLTVLKLYIMPFVPVPLENVFNNLSTFANCPLKTLDLRTSDIFMPPLLTLLGRHWGGTLEVLEIRCLRFSQWDHDIDDRNADHAENATWMVNLQFPKLRSFLADSYPLSRNWSFLLLFPALEELVFYELPEDDEEEEEEEEDAQPLIKLRSNRNAVLSSNLWKLFPKLKKVTFDDNEIESVTRNECVAAQMEIDAE